MNENYQSEEFSSLWSEHFIVSGSYDTKMRQRGGFSIIFIAIQSMPCSFKRHIKILIFIASETGCNIGAIEG